MFERKDKNGNVGTYYLGKSFILRELLPKEFYDKWEERDFAFERFQNDSSKTEKLDVLSKVHSELFTMAVHVNKPIKTFINAEHRGLCETFSEEIEMNVKYSFSRKTKEDKEDGEMRYAALLKICPGKYPPTMEEYVKR